MKFRIVQFESHFQQDFINLYKTVFGGAPYYEDFTDNEVSSIIKAQNLFIMVNDCNKELLGFVAGRPLSHTGSNRQIWDLIDFPENVNYVCELGVSLQHRGKGLGTKLLSSYIDFTLKVLGKNCSFALRTKRDDNVVARKLYHKLGFQLLRDGQTNLPIQIEAKHPRLHDKNETDVRICYIKNTNIKLNYFNRDNVDLQDTL